VFLLLRLLPAEYYFTDDQVMKLSATQKHDMLETAGLLDSPLEQLFHYYGRLLHFDFGQSRRIQSGVSVIKVIGKRFGISMKNGATALGLALVLGVALGMVQTRYKNRVPDHLGTAYTIFVNAVPPLVSYSLVLVVGSRLLGLPQLYSMQKPWESSILPIVCLALGNIAFYSIWTRRYMIDEMNKDYIKLARVKGLSQKEIISKHVLRNAFVPLAQYLPGAFVLTIGGSLLAEKFFSVPGMGPLLTDAIGRYDLNVVQTLVILYAALGIMGVFLGDVLMILIDPRITLVGKGGTR
jgi:oligopeptide transport system permease protein